MPLKHYAIGDPVTSAECSKALAAIVPPQIRQRLRGQEARMLFALQTRLPNRFAHEVNRCRGSAYDSGEHGFSHSKE